MIQSLFQRGFTVTIAAFLALVASVSFVTSPAHATPNQDTIQVYLDAPFVQGSYVAQAGGAGTGWTSFNNTTGLTHCGDSQPTGVTITGNCRIDAVGAFGGATPDANNSTATVAGAGSAYATTVNSTDAITVTLANDNRYVGLWWSAGSPSNTVKFYHDSTLLLTMTTADIMTLLGTAPTSGANWISRNDDSAGNVITTVGGGSYRKIWYFGNPRGYTTTSPTVQSTITSNEPFVYLHFFVGGSLTFNKIVLSGGGFEFDNLAVATQAQTPSNGLVLASTLYSNHTVQFDANATDATGSMSNQIASTTTALSSNQYSRPGYTFAGWNTAADGTGTAYSNSANYDFNVDLTLFAQWTQNTVPASDTSTLPNTGINVYREITAATVALCLGFILLSVRRRKRS